MDISKIRIGVLLIFAAAAGCGHSTDATDGGHQVDQRMATVDQSVLPDQSMLPDESVLPDQSVLPDLSMLPDLSKPVTGACASAQDCRLFSSSCGSCTCIPLGNKDPDPTCNMMMVNCFVDPCLKKTAACVNNMCVAQ